MTIRNGHGENGKISRRSYGYQDPDELSSYLKGLGLGQGQIAKVMPLLRATDGEERRGEERRFELPRREGREASMARHIKLYLAEEQQILQEAYQAFFSSQSSIELMGTSGDTSSESLIAAGLTFQPTVMLIGVKTLQPATVEKLEGLRERCPEVAIVLLSSFYDIHGIKTLREFLRSSPVGCAYLLKHTVDTAEQLTQVVHSVAEGRVTLDPTVMDSLMSTGEGHSAFLKELSPRETEVLSWMAKGYRNDTIASVLGRDPKTIERHINSIYSKLENVLESRHPRVHAVLLYLKSSGLLLTDQFPEA